MRAIALKDPANAHIPDRYWRPLCFLENLKQNMSSDLHESLDMIANVFEK